MRTKAIADLVQLSDDNLFREVSHGMRAVIANAETLISDARLLADAQRHRSSTLLLAVAEEEAAKYHILLDAVRCKRKSTNFLRQLKRFNDHLAKGLYARYAYIAPASYGEAIKYLEHERKSLYLDGPNDIDWIFRNRILQDREEVFFVDYIEADGKHTWLEPSAPPPIGSWFHAPRTYTLAKRLSEAGFDDPLALRVIAAIWADVQFTPTDHWQKCHLLNLDTLNELATQSLLSSPGQADAQKIAWDWLFPLHSAELFQIDVGLSELKAIQDAWHPEF